jgi:type IV secretion system protein VirB10
MTVRERGDPRLEELFALDAAKAGARPVVRLPRQGLPGWGIALAAGFAAILLFIVLDSRRGIQPQPPVREGVSSEPLFSPEPPPLYIPPALAPAQQPQVVVPPAPLPAPAAAPAKKVVPEPQPQVMYQSSPVAAPAPGPLPPAAPPPRTSAGSALVVDTTASQAGSTGAAPANKETGLPGVSSMWGGRVQASALANRSDTVTQGTLIPAVLETAFDSTSAGLARAIVSHDVRGFDGTRILIPRGSRLIGEYGAEIASGQKRALITWTRLIRPDGIMINLDSPATDTLGRGGIEAHVNSHFFARFLNAILRTTLDVGGAIATRAVTGPLVIAVPGAVQSSGNVVQSSGTAPTLTISAGKSISIFVARDLEFPSGTQR